MKVYVFKQNNPFMIINKIHKMNENIFILYYVIFEIYFFLKINII